MALGNLSKDIFERRTSTGSQSFSLFICLDTNKFVLLSFFSLIKTIYPRVSTEPLPNDGKSPLRVDGRRTKTLLLKLPINSRSIQTLLITTQSNRMKFRLYVCTNRRIFSTLFFTRAHAMNIFSRWKSIFTLYSFVK